MKKITLKDIIFAILCIIVAIKISHFSPKVSLDYFDVSYYSRVLFIYFAQLCLLFAAFFYFTGRYAAISKITIVILILFSLHYCAYDINEEFPPTKTQFYPNDGITQFEMRFNPVKDDLPSHGVIGYIAGHDKFNNVAFFFLTEYALCPLIVHESRQHSMFVGLYDITDSTKPIWANETDSLRIIKDYGNGTALLEKE